jgi:glycosyltransferase involved in cell wall biosynthesis
MLTKKYWRELNTISQIKNRKNSSIIYSSRFVKNYYTNSMMFSMYKKTLQDKSNLIPLCIKKKEKIKFKYEYLEKKLKNYKLKVSFIGRVCESKGIDHILNISKKLNKNSKIIFFIGGATNATDKKKILKYKKKFNLKNLILSLEGIPNEKVRSLYSLFDISLHFSNVPEGTSYSIMESMISNCIPMSNYSSEMIKKEHGYVFNKIDYDEIIFKINKLIDSKKLIKLKKNSFKNINLNYNENILRKNFKAKLSI